MAHEFTTSYLKDATDLFRYYKNLGERAMAQCSDEALFATPDAESNSIAVIVKHLSGNMRSRWADFIFGKTSDCENNREMEITERSARTVKAVHCRCCRREKIPALDFQKRTYQITHVYGNRTHRAQASV
jgi:hypothetical protein